MTPACHYPPGHGDWKSLQHTVIPLSVEWEWPSSSSTGSKCLSAHHAENSFHLLAYCARVDGALAFKMVPLTSSLHSFKTGPGPGKARCTGSEVVCDPALGSRGESLGVAIFSCPNLAVNRSTLAVRPPVMHLLLHRAFMASAVVHLGRAGWPGESGSGEGASMTPDRHSTSCSLVTGTGQGLQGF